MLKQCVTFCLGSKRWMLVALEAINPLAKQTYAPRKKFWTGIFPSFKSLNPSFLNALRSPGFLKNLKETIEIIGTIKETVVIMALADSNL